MFQDWAERRRVVAETERKAIDRWFSPSPLGLLFHGDDGTARPIAPDVAEGFKREANRMILEVIEEEPVHVVLTFGIAIGAGIVLWCIADLFGLNKSGAGVTGFLIGMSFAHFYPMIRIAHVRGQHRALRQRISESLRATAPVPAPLAARFRRRNPFKLATELTVGALILVAMLATEDDRYMQAFAIFAMFGVPAAWIFFGLSKYTDAHPDKPLFGRGPDDDRSPDPRPR